MPGYKKTQKQECEIVAIKHIFNISIRYLSIK